MFYGFCLNICHCWKWFSYCKLKFIILEWRAIFVCASLLTSGQDSVVSITTCTGLHGPGIEYRWGEFFHTPVHSGPRNHAASYTRDTGVLSRA